MNVGERLGVALGLVFRIVFFKYRLKLALKGSGICFRVQPYIGVKIIESPIALSEHRRADRGMIV